MPDCPLPNPTESFRPAVSPAQREEIERIRTEMRDILSATDTEESCLGSSEAERDREAIEDEKMFIRRFGFDWPRSDRVALLELKHRCDLTDREIRLLKWTGSLKCKGGVVTITSNRGMAIFGKCLIAVMCIEFVLVMLASLLAVHHPLSGWQVAKI